MASNEVTKYPGRTIRLGVTSRAFDGLAHQNMRFDQAVLELVDNSLAAVQPGQKALIQLLLIPKSKDTLTLVILDWGIGMDAGGMEAALQLGAAPVSGNRLNEHGFGLKNALASLSMGSGAWTLASRKAENQPYCVTQGPFDVNMTLYELPDLQPVLPAGVQLCRPDPRTVVVVDTPVSYARTMQSRGGPCSDAVTMRSWLLEHFGVKYRGYLNLDRVTMEPSAKILITVGDSSLPVPPVEVPIANAQTVKFPVELGGQVVCVTYRYGLLDTERRDHLIMTPDGLVKAKCYYQGNIPTQGIDIRMGKRVIATAQLEQIWRSDRGEPLARHNCYNAFVGELLLPELPRGVLPTLNNKTGLDLADSGWQNLCGKLNEYMPPKSVKNMSEERLKQRWMDILKAACPTYKVTDECSVWPTGTRIDVVAEAPGKLELYELKAGRAEPQNLYQLKMYWDGLVLQGCQPTHGTLLVQNYSSDLKLMLDQMNRLPPPLTRDGRPSAPYALDIATHAEKHLS